MREGRRLGQIARHTLNRAAFDLLQHGDQTVNVHCFAQTIVNRLSHQWMIRDFAIARDILQASQLVGKDRRQQILRFHALERRRNPLSAALPRQGQRAGCVPAPANRKHGRIEQGLHQKIANRSAVQITKNLLQWKRVLRPQREHNRIIGRSRLQFEVERPAETFAQGQPPGPVHSNPEGRVQDQLHAA